MGPAVVSTAHKINPESIGAPKLEPNKSTFPSIITIPKMKFTLLAALVVASVLSLIANPVDATSQPVSHSAARPFAAYTTMNGCRRARCTHIFHSHHLSHPIVPPTQ
jgi:hypothetical protein